MENSLRFADIVTVIVLLGAALSLVAAALLIWVLLLAIRVERALRILRPEVERTSDGRPLKERL
jgi:hypothetical protein